MEQAALLSEDPNMAKEQVESVWDGAVACMNSPLVTSLQVDTSDVPAFDLEQQAPHSANETAEAVAVLHPDDDGIPYAVASALSEPLLSEAVNNTAIVHRTSAFAMARPVIDDPERSSGLQRPEFLYATAIKPCPGYPVGLFFKKNDEGVIYISRIADDSLFRNTGIEVGDSVLAINNIRCLGASLKHLLSLIQAADSTISICVRNPEGDPHSFSSSVQKPTKDAKLGISFQMKRGALRVSKVSFKEGLFSQSLLMPDHRCLMINGLPCDTMLSRDAADMVADANRVTIVSRPRGDLATVLSIGDVEVGSWGAVALGAGVAAAAWSAIGS